MHWLSAGNEILRVQDCSRRTSTNCTPSQLTEGLNFLEYIPFATTVISPRYGQYKWTRIRIKMSAKGALQKASTAYRICRHEVSARVHRGRSAKEGRHPAVCRALPGEALSADLMIPSPSTAVKRPSGREALVCHTLGWQSERQAHLECGLCFATT